MNRLPLALAFILVIALAATAIARGPNAPAPPGNAYGAYGCCCPWSAYLGICPVTPGELLRSFDDVCVTGVDEFGNPLFCEAGQEGAYPYRGQSLRQIALGAGFRSVAGLLDALCGTGWDQE